MKSRLHYICKKPTLINENTPLLVLIHGYGSNEEDLFSFAEQFDERYLIVSVRAPLVLPFGGFSWYSIDFDGAGVKKSNISEALQSRDMLLEFIAEIQEKYHISIEKTTLIGFSQGAILSYSLALSYPNKIQKIVALSGYLFEEIISAKEPEVYTDTAIFTSHGTADQVIPVEAAQKISPYLKLYDIKHTYTEYPVGHTVAPQNFFDAKDWIDKRAL